VLCGIMILAVIARALLLPALAHGHTKSQVNCSSKLKQIGLAWLTWAHDQETTEFPFRTPIANEGTMGSTDPFKNEAWWQFCVISNQLGSPEILVCPADNVVGEARNIATDWGRSKKGGFMAPGFRDRAVSYTIGLEAGTTSNSRGGADGPTEILATDRNIVFDDRDGTCSSGVGDAWLIRVKGKNGQDPPATAAWKDPIHRMHGNVLTQDGAVQMLNTAEFDALCDRSDDNGRIHFLVPK